jgi:hypothetical protein
VYELATVHESERSDLRRRVQELELDVQKLKMREQVEQVQHAKKLANLSESLVARCARQRSAFASVDRFAERHESLSSKSNENS